MSTSFKAGRLAQLAAVRERRDSPAPERVIWQITRACDLCCVPCRSEVLDRPMPGQLTLDEGLDLIEQIRRTGQPQLVLTGGDPLKRPDIGLLILYAHRLGLPVSLTLSGTPRTTPRMVGLLRAAGLQCLTFCIDGPDQRVHDGFRGMNGSFAWTMDGVRSAQGIGLPIAVETSFTPQTIAHLDALAQLVGRLGARTWQVTFGTGNEPGGAFSKDQHAAALQRLATLRGTVNYRIRVSPAPYFVGSGVEHGCDTPWRALELFVSDDGIVERWNSGEALGSLRQEPFAEMVRKALRRDVAPTATDAAPPAVALPG